MKSTYLTFGLVTYSLLCGTKGFGIEAINPCPIYEKCEQVSYDQVQHFLAEEPELKLKINEDFTLAHYYKVSGKIVVPELKITTKETRDRNSTYYNGLRVKHVNDKTQSITSKYNFVNIPISIKRTFTLRPLRDKISITSDLEVPNIVDLKIEVPYPNFVGFGWIESDKFLPYKVGFNGTTVPKVMWFGPIESTLVESHNSSYQNWNSNLSKEQTTYSFDDIDEHNILNYSNSDELNIQIPSKFQFGTTFLSKEQFYTKFPENINWNIVFNEEILDIFGYTINKYLNSDYVSPKEKMVHPLKVNLGFSPKFTKSFMNISYWMSRDQKKIYVSASVTRPGIKNPIYKKALVIETPDWFRGQHEYSPDITLEGKTLSNILTELKKRMRSNTFESTYGELERQIREFNRTLESKNYYSQAAKDLFERIWFIRNRMVNDGIQSDLKVAEPKKQAWTRQFVGHLDYMNRQFYQLEEIHVGPRITSYVASTLFQISESMINRIDTHLTVQPDSSIQQARAIIQRVMEIAQDLSALEATGGTSTQVGTALDQLIAVTQQEDWKMLESLLGELPVLDQLDRMVSTVVFLCDLRNEGK